ncbi:hypothetical protein L3V82_12290 [Thiotrichales bacterium 19S3-7]|nr:hypothetical protein [Thiotrichales bacterium 19S3-7]MCF6802969.1 hypothetical protein [Thiotrichales bacterium 19S3-11]
MKKITQLSFIFSLVMCNYSFASLDTSNWMAQLSDSTKINQLVLPGSHDAGMYLTKHCTFFVAPQWAQAQGSNIYDQLSFGSRYFDIRISDDFDDNRLTTYHRSDGIGCDGDFLDNILEQTTEFLRQHPNEFVILKFSHTRSDGKYDPKKETSEVVNLLEDKYKQYLFVTVDKDINLANLQLEQVRGKIIAVFDGEYDHDNLINPHLGTFSYSDYNPNNKTINSNIAVYDQYSDKSNYNKMKTDQIDKLHQYGGLGQNYLFLLSWTLTGSISELDIKKLANTANEHLKDELHDLIINQQYPKPNIVYIDFMSQELGKEIIQYNNF